MASAQGPLSSGAQVAIATNNGDIGGGEVMMLRIADALRADGFEVTIVAPRSPDGVAVAAASAGHRVEVLKARSRIEWMIALRRWDARSRRGTLWCNGLVPAAATAGHKHRIVHLHQRPTGAQKVLTSVAHRGASALFVPSKSMLEAVPDARVMPNWTDAVQPTRRVREDDEPFVVGFLGRVSIDKGIRVLSEAMQQLDARRPGAFRLAMGGEARFISRKERDECEAALEPIAKITDRLGWVERDDFFSRIDLLVVPSISPESFGLVAAEAMSARVPVLVSDAGALPEVVGDGYRLSVPAGDPTALASAIDRAASGEGDSYVVALYERWCGFFSPEAGARQMQELMSGVIR